MINTNDGRMVLPLPINSDFCCSYYNQNMKFPFWIYTFKTSLNIYEHLSNIQELHRTSLNILPCIWNICYNLLIYKSRGGCDLIPKNDGQKLQLFYIADYLMRETDDELDEKDRPIHGVFVGKI